MLLHAFRIHASRVSSSLLIFVHISNLESQLICAICVDLLQSEDVMCPPDQLDDPKLGDDYPRDSILQGEIL